MGTPSLHSSILYKYLLPIDSFSLLHCSSFNFVNIYQNIEIQKNCVCKKQQALKTIIYTNPIIFFYFRFAIIYTQLYEFPI